MMRVIPESPPAGAAPQARQGLQDYAMTAKERCAAQVEAGGHPGVPKWMMAADTVAVDDATVKLWRAGPDGE
jgi:hypothetical protein